MMARRMLRRIMKAMKRNPIKYTRPNKRLWGGEEGCGGCKGE